MSDEKTPMSRSFSSILSTPVRKRLMIFLFLLFTCVSVAIFVTTRPPTLVSTRVPGKHKARSAPSKTVSTGFNGDIDGIVLSDDDESTNAVEAEKLWNNAIQAKNAYSLANLIFGNEKSSIFKAIHEDVDFVSSKKNIQELLESEYTKEPYSIPKSLIGEVAKNLEVLARSVWIKKYSDRCTCPPPPQNTGNSLRPKAKKSVTIREDLNQIHI